MEDTGRLAPGVLLLNGKYRIEEFLGKGAFAQVYRVTHVTLNVARAIKVLRRDAPGVGSTVYSDFRQRFELEAQLGAIERSHVIRVYDVERDGDTLILLMDYAAGGSLADRLAAHGPLPPAEVTRWLLDAARGLAALHSEGIIHRDVKPSNLLLDEKGRVKVADLGLAQLGDGQFSGRPELGSAAGAHPGTPHYRSPEHNGWELLAPTSDVYSLGCTAFELLTGKVWKLARHKTASARDLRPDIPLCLDEVVMQMLCETPGLSLADANNPQKRYVDAETLAAALEDVLNELVKILLDEAQALFVKAQTAFEENDFATAETNFEMAQTQLKSLLFLQPDHAAGRALLAEVEQQHEFVKRYRALAAQTTDTRIAVTTLRQEAPALADPGGIFTLFLGSRSTTKLSRPVTAKMVAPESMSKRRVDPFAVGFIALGVLLSVGGVLWALPVHPNAWGPLWIVTVQEFNALIWGNFLLGAGIGAVIGGVSRWVMRHHSLRPASVSVLRQRAWPLGVSLMLLLIALASIAAGVGFGLLRLVDSGFVSMARTLSSEELVGLKYGNAAWGIAAGLGANGLWMLAAYVFRRIQSKR